MNNNSQKTNTSIYWCKKAGLNQNNSLLSMEEMESSEMFFEKFIKAGKTTLCLNKTDADAHSLNLQIGLSISREYPVSLNDPVKLFGNTLYILANQDKDMVWNKLDRLLINPELPNTSKYKMLLYPHGSKIYPDLINIINLIEKYKPVLVVLAYSYRQNIRDEKSSIEAKKYFMNTLIQFLQTTSSAVLISRPWNKKSRLEKEMLSPPYGYFIFRSNGNKHSFSLSSVHYSNHAEQNHTKKFFIDWQTNWFTEEKNNPVQNQFISISKSNTDMKTEKHQQRFMALALHGQGKSYSQIAKTLKKPKTTIYRWINKQSGNNISE